MSTVDMLTPFDRASALWAEHEANPCAADVEPGDLLDITTELQIEIMREAARAPAKNAADLAAKKKIADHVDRVLAGFEDDSGDPLTAGLRRSISADLMRLGRVVLFEQEPVAA
ncbi:hypothetical protein [Mesorhizobium sp. DCY119]|uniref:hypothetical protein n=1 Tax=Mesorhizobium sp. DCY119 TaxID=2108445 RepID=UPI000E6C5F0B|nr:hypothetical protein [Mesorhizobium sp. DCY119]RJG43729.1 hypothetical protein D3Y55_05280 [Mesorhizobium sp. DCY119]